MSVATGTVKDEEVFCRSGRGDPSGRPYIGHPNNVCYRRRAVFFHTSDEPGWIGLLPAPPTVATTITSSSPPVTIPSHLSTYLAMRIGYPLLGLRLGFLSRRVHANSRPPQGTYQSKCGVRLHGFSSARFWATITLNGKIVVQ